MPATSEALAYTPTVAGVLGLIANLLQLISIRRDKNRNNSSFAVVLLSLNISDLLTSFAFLLRGVIFLILKFLVANLSLFYFVDHMTITAITFSLISSFSHLILIAIQRMVAVAFPLKVKQIITRSRCHVALICLWLTSIIIAVFVFFYVKVALAIVYLALITGAVLMIMYAIICFRVMKRNVASNQNEEVQRRHKQADKEVFLYSVAVTVIFILCTYPGAIIILVRNYRDVPRIVGDSLISLNPLLDTLLYFAWSYYKQRKPAVVKDALTAADPSATNKDAPGEITTRL